MHSFKSVLSASAIAFFATTNAHMKMAQPPPYGNPDNSPLDASGSNFPCKSTSNTGGPVTNMAVGSEQEMSFIGGATHGGGSCQISLTTDNPAKKTSVWQVIHSIEGGCPARGQAGNAGGSDSMIDPDKYKYTIPQGIAPGTYTLAWTWFNKIGNREMYMNCANIKVTGGSKKRDDTHHSHCNESQYAVPELSERATASFPPMFVANIPVSDCTTPESTSIAFPNPGSSIEKNEQTLANPTGPKCGAAGSSASSGSAGGSSSGSAASGSGSSAAAPASSAAGAAASQASTSSGSTSAPDSQANAGSSGSSSAAPSAAAAGGAGSSNGSSGSAGSSGSPAAPSAAAGGASPSTGSSGSASPSSGSSSSSGTSSGASTASKGTCSQPGQSICSPDSKQIGTCDSDMTVVWIPVAAGTKCSGGQMVMANSKRSARFPSNYRFAE